MAGWSSTAPIKVKNSWMSRPVCAAVWDRQSRICSTENNTLLSWVAPARFLLEIAAEDRHPLLLLDRARPLVQLQTFRRMSPQLKPPQLSVVVELEPQRPRQPHQPNQPGRPGRPVAQVVRASLPVRLRYRRNYWCLCWTGKPLYRMCSNENR